MTRSLIVSFASALCIVHSAFAQVKAPPTTQPAVPTDWRALTAAPQSVDLSSLRPLPIVHYSWPIRAQDVLPAPAWWLHDYIRITRGATIHADTSTTEAHVRALCKIARQYNASVAILMGPYHHTSWPTIPGTHTADPRRTDATYWPWWTARLTTMKKWIEAEGCTVGMMIFDCERFILKQPEEKLATEWNTAARQRYDEAYDAVKSVFGPDCYVEWYSRGWYRPIGVDRLQRYLPYGHFDLTEKADGVSYVLTRPDWTLPSIGAIYETALRSPGVDDPLVVWIYVACGYKLSDDRRTLSFVDDWNFAPALTKELGRIPSDFRSRLRAVIFYPEPGRNRGWLLHFKAYAERAAAQP